MACLSIASNLFKILRANLSKICKKYKKCPLTSFSFAWIACRLTFILLPWSLENFPPASRYLAYRAAAGLGSRYNPRGINSLHRFPDGPRRQLQPPKRSGVRQE
jgi:hypothetical protein